MSTWIRFYGFFKPYLAYGVVLLALLIIGNFGSLATPYFLKIIIDRVFGEHNYELLINILFALVGIYVLRIFSGFFADYLYTWISNKITVNLTNNLFSHMLQLPIGFFRDQSVGAIVYKINNEVGQVRRAFTGSVINMLNNILTIIGLITLMIILNVKLFLLVSMLYPLLLVVMKWFSPSIKKVVETTRRQESDMLAFLTERFSNIKFIKLFSSYLVENTNMNSRIQEIVKLNLKSTVLSSASNSLSVFLLALIPLIVLAYGGKLVLDDMLTIGTLIAFLQYANKLHEPLRNVASLYVDLVKTSVSIKRIFELLDEPVHTNIQEQKISVPLQFQEIKFDNVSFSHKGKTVLKDFNFSFKLGKHYAIVGPSGSGKTTMADLMTGIITPDKGKILIDDTDLNLVSMVEWMDRLSMCSQEYFILNGSAYENFLYGNSKKIEEVDLLDILKRFKLGDHNSSDIMNRSLGEAGSQLSGGQKQKISIARCVLRNPHVLILDEATSEIDAASEESIFQFLADETQISTLITITHRISTLKFSDEIIYMEHGRVVERGSLDYLISIGGHFFTLFKNHLNTPSSVVH